MKQLKLAAYVNRAEEPVWIQFDIGRNYTVTKEMSEATVVASFDDGIALLADIKMLQSSKMRDIVNAESGSIVFFLYEIARCDTTKPIISNVVAQRLYRF